MRHVDEANRRASFLLLSEAHCRRSPGELGLGIGQPNPPNWRQQEVVASGGLDRGSRDYGVYLTVAQPAAGMANCSGLPLTDTV